MGACSKPVVPYGCNSPPRCASNRRHHLSALPAAKCAEPAPDGRCGLAGAGYAPRHDVRPCAQAGGGVAHRRAHRPPLAARDAPAAGAVGAAGCRSPDRQRAGDDRDAGAMLRAGAALSLAGRAVGPFPSRVRGPLRPDRADDPRLRPVLGLANGAGRGLRSPVAFARAARPAGPAAPALAPFGGRSGELFSACGGPRAALRAAGRHAGATACRNAGAAFALGRRRAHGRRARLASPEPFYTASGQGIIRP
ncbi:hypothetical protein SAMN05421757_107220 [Tropicimonas sediminicola]|uniref:Uncharacterized protein n=1 Tax=Tropicimonas sediminicola TaxID=1031541 RepID=A0A239KNW3_9RHOB|nr:hypothetical protein SAMN05421757_107220 [Tropicimonas sediminicola]